MTIDGEFSKLYATDTDGVLAGYNGYNMHFHSPSEHKIEGATFDAELHIMHSMRSEFNKGQGRTTAVVAVLFKVNDNERPNEFLDSLSLGSPGPATVDMTLLRKALPADIVYFSYQGSRTSPPCDEVVNWYVVESPVTITSAQLAVFNRLWKNNQDFAKGNGNNRLI